MNSKLFFKTAEFAHLCQTTKHTLIHYDDIGLLKPDKVSENKYRYYSIAQFDEYHTISELRTMGVPLKEIKEKLHNSSPVNFQYLLKKQKQVLEKQLDALQDTVTSIDTQLMEIQSFLETKPNEVRIQHLHAAPLLMTHSTIVPDPDAYAGHYAELINQIPQDKQGIGYRFGAMKNLKHIQKHDNDAYSHFYLRILNHKTSTMRNAGKYLITYYVGDFENIIPSYDRLINYANTYNLSIENVFYEEIIINRIATGNQDNIVQIMVHILP